MARIDKEPLQVGSYLLSGGTAASATKLNIENWSLTSCELL